LEEKPGETVVVAAVVHAGRQVMNAKSGIRKEREMAFSHDQHKDT
jgi:hypothetical protein